VAKRSSRMVQGRQSAAAFLITCKATSMPPALCFFKVPDDVLMWSHYSEKHRGVCLKFVATDSRKQSAGAAGELPAKFRRARFWDDHTSGWNTQCSRKAACGPMKRSGGLFDPTRQGNTFTLMRLIGRGDLWLPTPQADRNRIRSGSLADRSLWSYMKLTKFPTPSSSKSFRSSK